MAEYIEREALIREIKTAQETLQSDDDLLWELNKKYHSGLAWAHRIVIESPAADVAPVVRCKECKHWHEELGWCDKHSHFVDADGEFCHPWESTVWEMFDADYFCKDGERRANK